MSGGEGVEVGGAHHCMRIERRLWPRSRSTDRPHTPVGLGKGGTWVQTGWQPGDLGRRA